MTLPDPSHGEPVPVRFRGGGTGAEVLSWGQQDLWQVMQDKHNWLPIGKVLPLPAGTTLAGATEDLAFVMGSFPSMRTRLRLEPDGPRQVVSESGEVALELIDAPDDADPAELARQVWWRNWRRDYDFEREWPLRMSVVRHRGVLTHRAWVMCHLVTDGIGARVIVQELTARDCSGSTAALSALEQARWQRSPAGQRQCEAALRYWGGVLREVPARRFPERPGTGYPRYWQGAFDSPATELAARVVAARTCVEVPSVLLGFFAVALARATGQPRVVFQTNVSNRFRPGLARTVSPVIQNGLFTMEVPDATVDEAVALTRRRALVAYKHAYYHPGRRDELVAQVGRERGEPVDLGAMFNDRRLKPRDHGGPPPTAEQVRAAVPQGTFQWRHRQDEIEFYKLAVVINDHPETLDAAVTCDVHYVQPELVEACVRGVEEVAVAAALDPDARTGVRSAVTGAR